MSMITEIEIRGALKGCGYPTTRMTFFKIGRKWCAFLVSPTSSASTHDLELLKELRKLGMETAITHGTENAVDYVEQWEDDQGFWRHEVKA